MDNLNAALEKGISGIAAALKKSLRDAKRYATGRTERKIKDYVKKTDKGYTATVSGPLHIGALQDGRRATPPGAPSSNGAFLQSLREWMQAKGIEGDVHALWNHIHKFGYKGTPGVVKNALDPAKAKELLKEGAKVDIRKIMFNALSQKK